MSDQASTKSASSSTSPVREDAQDSAGGTAEEKPKTVRTFGGMTPSEAARLRHQRDRERKAEGAQVDETGHDRVVLVRTPVRIGQIVKALEKDAAKGNARAARELRSWMAEYGADRDTDVSDLDRRTRQALLARLLAELEEDGQVDVDAVLEDVEPAA